MMITTLIDARHISLIIAKGNQVHTYQIIINILRGGTGI